MTGRDMNVVRTESLLGEKLEKIKELLQVYVCRMEASRLFHIPHAYIRTGILNNCKSAIALLCKRFELFSMVSCLD